MSRARMPYFSLARTTMERPSGVSSASEASCAASARVLRGDAADGAELGGLPVAEGDRAGLVEEQRVDVARRLDGAAGHGEHVEADQPVHAGDADGREQRADGRGDQRDEQGDQHDHGDRPARVAGEARDRGHREDEHEGEAGEQDVQGDLVRRLLPRGALDEGDHAVDEGRAGGGGDADLDLVGEDLRAAGHRRAVAAGLADHRGGLAGDGGLVDGGDALDHLAVGGDQVAGLDEDDVADLERGAGHASRRPRPWPVRRLAVISVRVRRRLSAWALPRPSARASAKLAKIRVNHSQRMIWPEKRRSLPPVRRSRANRTVVRSGHDLDDEHDRVPDHGAGVESS